MQALNVNGRAIHFRLDRAEEKGPLLAFSNSLGTDLRVFDGIVDRLPANWRILRYDTAGHGLSGHAERASIGDHAADLLAILDHVEADKAYVAGLSVGGMIAQALASARPDRVAALCLMDTAPKIGTAEMWTARMDAIRAGGIEAVAEPVMERWFSAAFRASRPAELAVWRSMLTRTPVEGYLDLCAAIRDADLTDRARRLDLPVLFICGSEDGSTPPELVKAAAELVPGARYLEIEGAGHLPCVESPDAVAAAITGFFKEHGA
ncbi:3-oxoadipate enol-lactonase [Stappia sp. F7233]|uniref:3-oxoadipate enol-lactonase n=1 Tax=Stappia albiluteola TaxID=2758565 RepID=A0A839AG57_9HYPH|nr:3-oxoadipate enol-lactonase [Stappia albiluteola]MBA5778850.1 3-oxoadipate enol-lactonase [Stappia albiluteola]